MKLRIGQSVYSTDGVFGEVADIVVDPTGHMVTHLVIEPYSSHQQARLVPMWLVSVSDGAVKIGLAESYVRQLQRVGFDDFVPVRGPIELDGSWDVDETDLVASPYWDVGGLIDANGEPFESYAPVPKQECEVRRRSDVTTLDLRVVGRVEGFLTTGDQLVALVVQGSRLRRQQYKVVPMDRVASVFNDEVVLSIDQGEYEALAPAPQLAALGSPQPSEHDGRPKRTAEVLMGSASRLASRTRHRHRRIEAEKQLDAGTES